MVPNYGTRLSGPTSRMMCRCVNFQLIQALLLLHVDDVLCLWERKYLDEVLMSSLQSKYKVACETVCKAGDELTFLTRRNVTVSEDEMAIQSHPKHLLEGLFDLLAISRRLKANCTLLKISIDY